MICTSPSSSSSGGGASRQAPRSASAIISPFDLRGVRVRFIIGAPVLRFLAASIGVCTSTPFHAQVPVVAVWQRPEQHSAEVVQAAPEDRQVAASAGVGERIEVINGKDPS